ncbi:MAG: hypothetical protein D6766_04410 [Verrucomicrobia bacterium]|nr:MAG: hypothetical protein D6766_04410 [Verrucomicrobiota bacterium]
MNAACRDKVTRRFFWSVGALFTFTALLKVLALIHGRHLAMRPDPVFWFVSARVTSVVAICLEFAIVAMLVCRAPARHKLAMLCWVAGLFLIYRVMWMEAVPAPEPCPCFGLFWQQLGVKAVFGNRVSMAILIYVALGSVLLLARERRRGLARSSGQANATIAGRRLQTGLVVALALGGGAHLTPSVGRAGEPAEAAGFQMCAEGRADINYLTGREPEHLRFQLEVSGRKTGILVSGFNNSDILTNAFFYDGHLACHVLIFSPDRRKPSLVLDPNTGEPSWDTNKLVRPLNDANLILCESPLPREAPVLPLWLAFCSGPYLSQWSVGRMEKLFDLERTQRMEPLIVPCEVRRSDKPPGLLTFLATLDDARAHTNELFRVLAWRTMSGLSLPARFEFRLFESHHPPHGRLLTIIQCVVTNFWFPTNKVTERPQIRGRVSVADERFSRDPIPLPVVSYWTTNGNVPDASLVRSNHVYRAQVEIERAKMRRKLDAPWYVVFMAVALAPGLWIAWRGHARKRSKTN